MRSHLKSWKVVLSYSYLKYLMKCHYVEKEAEQSALEEGISCLGYS